MKLHNTLTYIFALFCLIVNIKAQLDRLIENPNAAVFNITVGSENMLRYMGGDPNLIKKFVDFRNKTWPDNGYVSKITHVWPAPFYQLN